MRLQDFQIHSTDRLDRILAQLCQLIIDGKKTNPDYYGMVSAAILDPNNNLVMAVNHVDDSTDQRVHAERAAVNKYASQYGKVPAGSIIITTLSPCSEHMSDRFGESCTDFINSLDIHKVYCGYEDPTQHVDHKQFHTRETRNPKLRELCKQFADTFLKENFADGKKPGRKGLAKRMGVNTKASVSDLRKTAKNSTGEKARMAHWLANMKSGRNK
jgi:pyrimidine deaminase RibD-like protein